MTARKPLRAAVGHSQRPTERAAWRGRGPGSASVAQPGRWGWPQLGGGWPQPMRGFTSNSFTRVGGLAVGGASVREARPGSRRRTGGRAGPTRSGRPALAAEGEDGFAVVAAGGAVGAALGGRGTGPGGR